MQRSLYFGFSIYHPYTSFPNLFPIDFRMIVLQASEKTTQSFAILQNSLGRFPFSPHKVQYFRLYLLRGCLLFTVFQGHPQARCSAPLIYYCYLRIIYTDSPLVNKAWVCFSSSFKLSCRIFQELWEFIGAALVQQWWVTWESDPLFHTAYQCHFILLRDDS